MKKLLVSDYMTPSVFTIGAEQTLAAAHETMRDHLIRHLPVLERGRLVGIVSQRDLYLMETIRGVEPSETLVEEAMSPNPFVVSPSSLLLDVIAKMLEHRWGSAIVAENGRIAGVFTEVDAMRALRDLLLPAAPRRKARHAP